MNCYDPTQIDMLVFLYFFASCYQELILIYFIIVAIISLTCYTFLILYDIE